MIKRLIEKWMFRIGNNQDESTGAIGEIKQIGFDAKLQEYSVKCSIHNVMDRFTLFFGDGGVIHTEHGRVGSRIVVLFGQFTFPGGPYPLVYIGKEADNLVWFAERLKR